jgi:hypothetical protein
MKKGGTSIGGAFFRPPYERVTRIPVTPAMLLLFANSGVWEIGYPAHTLPKKRWDIIINWIAIIAFVIIAIATYLRQRN